MKKTLVVISVLCVSPFIGNSQTKAKDTIRLFYLGGQSNMDGYGYNKELPKSLKGNFKDVWIFHGNPVPDENPTGGQGEWDILKPGQIIF